MSADNAIQLFEQPDAAQQIAVVEMVRDMAHEERLNELAVLAEKLTSEEQDQLIDQLRDMTNDRPDTDGQKGG